MYFNKIEILWKASPKQLKIDGKLYTIRDAAEKVLAMTPESLRVMIRRCNHDNEKLLENLNDLHWKRENGIAANKAVYHLDGERYIIDDFMQAIPCNFNTARNRADTAVRLKQSYEYATRPIDQNRSKKAKESREKEEPKKESWGLGPRKNINEIPGPGILEQKYFKDRLNM